MQLPLTDSEETERTGSADLVSLQHWDACQNDLQGPGQREAHMCTDRSHPSPTASTGLLPEGPRPEENTPQAGVWSHRTLPLHSFLLTVLLSTRHAQESIPGASRTSLWGAGPPCGRRPPFASLTPPQCTPRPLLCLSNCHSQPSDRPSTLTRDPHSLCTSSFHASTGTASGLRTTGAPPGARATRPLLTGHQQTPHTSVPHAHSQPVPSEPCVLRLSSSSGGSLLTPGSAATPSSPSPRHSRHTGPPNTSHPSRLHDWLPRPLPRNAGPFHSHPCHPGQLALLAGLSQMLASL